MATIKIFVCIMVISFIRLKTGPEPYRRGFLCNDDSLTLSYKGSTISGKAVVRAGILLPSVILLIIETVHRMLDKSKRKKCEEKTSLEYGSRCCKLIGCYLFGLGTVLAITSLLKLTVGRLRPHFFNLCQPDYGKFSCVDLQGNPLYITEYNCTNNDEEDVQKFKEMRMSFPSGHAAIAMYGMLFLLLFCQARMKFRGFAMLMFQALVVVAAVYTCLTRINDNMHHWTDVLGGALIGCIISALMVYHLSDILVALKSQSIDECSSTDDANMVNGETNGLLPLPRRQDSTPHRRPSPVQPVLPSN